MSLDERPANSDGAPWLLLSDGGAVWDIVMKANILGDGPEESLFGGA